MKTVRRLLYRDIVWSVVFVAAAFLSLFFFIDFVDELQDVGRGGYKAQHAALRCLLRLPSHAYELLPIAVLIGAIYALARLAQSSEYTILRTGGLGPGRALWLLTLLGLGFAAATFAVGDYLAPWSETRAAAVQARFKGGTTFGRTSAWLKEHRATEAGERSVSVNIGAAKPDGTLEGVRIFEFDADGRLVERIAAARARIDDEARWHLQDAVRTIWSDDGVAEQRVPALERPSTLDAGVVSAAVLPLGTMSTVELWRYSAHLAENEQAAQRHEIRFWRKALYPFACLVMLGLALPFAYLHARRGGISLKVFGGILLGISFVLMNNVAGHLGLLHGWRPLLVAATPSVVYMLMSLAAFAWLVRYR